MASTRQRTISEKNLETSDSTLKIESQQQEFCSLRNIREDFTKKKKELH